MDTRQKIRLFNLAFGRPVNSVVQESLPIAERELLGKLLLEEALEYAVKGLGLDVKIDVEAGRPIDEQYVRIEHREGVPMNVKEIIDGLADVDVVNHFAAHWHGFNLNYATHIVNESNMSKLDSNGKPIINHPDSPLYDPNKPIGKILKGPGFREPDFTEVIRFGNPPFDPGDDVGYVSNSMTPLHDYADRVAAGDSDISKPFESKED